LKQIDKDDKIYLKLFHGNNNKSIDTLHNSPQGLTFQNKRGQIQQCELGDNNHNSTFEADLIEKSINETIKFGEDKNSYLKKRRLMIDSINSK
jgi:hypothetical protein